MGANELSLFILQLAVGLTFAAHGAQKVFGWWGGPGLTAWEGAMSHMGFRPARLFGTVSALNELVGGLLLAVGFLTPLVAAVLVAQTVVIIGKVHLQHGFFNTKSGIRVPARPRRRRGRRRPGGPGRRSASTRPSASRSTRPFGRSCWPQASSSGWRRSRSPASSRGSRRGRTRGPVGPDTQRADQPRQPPPEAMAR